MLQQSDWNGKTASRFPMENHKKTNKSWENETN